MITAHSSTPVGAAQFGNPQLGGLREDMVKYLGPFIGQSKAVGVYEAIVSKIRSEAAAGAKEKMMPYLIGIFATTGVVAAISVAALMAAKRK